jgi:hypothetical protein
MTFKKVAKDYLINGTNYLVQTRHGLIEATWISQEEYFACYFWGEISFNYTGEVYENSN